MKKNFRAILGILVIFILGAVTGAMTIRMIYETRVAALVGGDWKMREDALVQRLANRLDLNDRQRDEVRSIIQDARKKLKDIYRQVGPQTGQARAEASSRIRAILAPEQAAKFDRLLAEKKER